MIQQMGSISEMSQNNRVDLMTSGPIIHLPETHRSSSCQKTSGVAMVNISSKAKVKNSAKVKASEGTEETRDTIIIHPGNFNLCRPGKSEEIVNGLQALFIKKKKTEAKQRKEAGYLPLSFLRNKTKQPKVFKSEENFQVLEGDLEALTSPKTKEFGRFGAVRDSIELTKRSVKNTTKHWLPSLNPIVSVQLIHPGQEKSSQPAIHLPASGACKGYSVTSMTTTLPRITPCSTPLPPAMAPTRSHSSASLYTSYGAYPPPELSSSVDFVNIPKRTNPLAPPPPRKRINWSWETVDQHHENEKRRLLMQKREHTRYHSAWSKAFYGSPAEMEAYRRHFREVLKQQMSDQDVSKKHELKQKVKETERAIAHDRECRMNDAHEYFRKHNYLMQFRDGNKNLMENTWDAKKYNKHVEDRIDRERLRYNPINWSCSLK